LVGRDGVDRLSLPHAIDCSASEAAEGALGPGPALWVVTQEVVLRPTCPRRS